MLVSGSVSTQPALPVRTTPGGFRDYRVLAGLLVCILMAGPAFGWGQEGHRVVALIAQQSLDAHTLEAIHALTGEESLEDTSVWLDEQRLVLKHSVPGSDRWHYDDRPVCAPDTPSTEYCSNGDCASMAYRHELAVLRDHHAPREARLFALRVLVHVIGDVHQPLHAANHDDRGGNGVFVMLHDGGARRSLHAAWDVDFVRLAMGHRSRSEFAHELLVQQRVELTGLATGSVDNWLQESFAIARQQVYGNLTGFSCAAASPGIVLLSPEYQRDAVETVRQRLTLAGIRLAGVLRDSFH
jgi:hypothetical protein